MMRTISAMIAEARRRMPGDSAAVAYGSAHMTLAALDGAGRSAARALLELGVERGDRVALWLPNTPAYLILWLGCARLGAIAVAVNTRFRSVEVADVLQRSSAKALALWPGFRGIPFLDVLGEIDRGALDRLETVILHTEADEGGGGAGDWSTRIAARGPDSGPGHSLPASLAHCRRVAFRDLLKRPPLDEDRAVPQDGANLFTTSGTTRAPKFVLHSHASVTAHAAVMARALGYGGAGGGGGLAGGGLAGGGAFDPMPLCGVFGFCQATAALAAGCTLVLVNAFDAAEAVRLVDEHRVRCLNVTDDMLMAMFDATPREVALPTVTACGFAAFAAEPDALLLRAEARGLPLVGLYGMSEVQAFFARQPLDADPARRVLGGGVPLDPAARVRVRDPESGRLLPPGETGELELAGPSLMREYFGDPEATAETVTADGFVRSGDLGRLGEEGGFVYLARMGDAMRLGGFLVSPAEIEGRLCDHPAVGGAQVVGLNTGAGPRPVAFVTLAPRGGGFDEKALRAYCEGALARFKVPVRIFAVDEFPTTKSANGTKIQRAELRRMAEERLGLPNPGPPRPPAGAAGP